MKNIQLENELISIYQKMDTSVCENDAKWSIEELAGYYLYNYSREELVEIFTNISDKNTRQKKAWELIQKVLYPGTDEIKDEHFEKLKNKILEGSLSDIEDFLECEISITILEDIDSYIEDAYQRMSEEEISSFKRRYKIQHNKIKSRRKKIMTNMKEKCVKEYNKFWKGCVSQAREELEIDGYTEDSEGVFVGVKPDDVIFLSDVATEIFENTVDVPEIIAGYYISLHGDDAFATWTNNVSGITLSDCDKEVDKILKEIYGG